MRIVPLLFAPLLVFGATFPGDSSHAQDILDCTASNWTPISSFQFPENNTPQVLQNIIDSGAVHLFGLKGRPNNLEQAKSLFNEAAERGYAPAQNILGALHLIGLSEDNSKHMTAENYFRDAATQKYPPAQNNLGLLYWNGWGTVSNQKTAAIDLISIAAQKNYAPAQNSLALIQKTEDSVDWGGKEALNLLKSATEKGFAPAAFNLGTYYFEGMVVERNYSEAAKLYSEAAISGNPWAQFNLGKMHALGLGVKSSLPSAYRWFGLASEAGVVDAAEQRATIEKFLSDDEKNNVQKLAIEMPVVHWSKVLSWPDNRGGNRDVYWIENLSPELVSAISKCSDFNYKMPGISWTKDFDWTRD